LSSLSEKRPYRKKHFYKTTWIRSEKNLRTNPWLEPEEHDFCIVGYCQPTPKEAEKFIGNIMYDRLFDKVSCVQEISKEEALRDFRMDNWNNQKVFGADKIVEQKKSLDSQIQSASNRAAESQPTSHVKAMEPEPEF